MNRLQRILFLSMLLTGAAAVHSFAGEGVELLHAGLVSLAVVSMVFLKGRLPFAVVLTLILGYGFSLAGYAFVQGWSGPEQYTMILHHLLLTITLLTVWLLYSDIRYILEENTFLKQELKHWKKYEDDSFLLTREEFLYQAGALDTAAVRKGEQNALVTLKQRARIPKDIRSSLQKETAQQALETVRNRFDLVTAEGGTIYLLLPGTKEQGVEAVWSRLSEKIRSTSAYREIPFTIEADYTTDTQGLMKKEEENVS
ncbi:hypothetical protein [Alkalicoccus chagannorensis]|uniref:hypothetical protein n=1 Tax=Alkalicoccus chagannorensis TaxID=427072 RepID=UPI000425A9A6|nr:hypothetical protein [Alkalicoccus chagannorensis]